MKKRTKTLLLIPIIASAGAILLKRQDHKLDGSKGGRANKMKTTKVIEETLNNYDIDDV